MLKYLCGSCAFGVHIGIWKEQYRLTDVRDLHFLNTSLVGFFVYSVVKGI